MQTVKTKVRSAPHYSIAFKRQSFLTSRMNEELAIRTRTFYTMLSVSANVSATNALGQSPRLVFVSRIRTTSPTWRFLKGFNRFWWCWSRGRYSFNPSFPKAIAQIAMSDENHLLRYRHQQVGKSPAFRWETMPVSTLISPVGGLWLV